MIVHNSTIITGKIGHVIIKLLEQLGTKVGSGWCAVFHVVSVAVAALVKLLCIDI